KDYQIATTDPYSLSFISHSFSKSCKAAGITGKTLHALRHTFALRKLIETNNIQLVKELLGHSSVTVTEIYTAFPVDFLAQVFKDRAINTQNFRPTIQA
ncbi:MAG: tyrosine-type recombinase/integrase, partial [Candidatus Marinimicrobia bacterium]|nr:tyrosine-type recombinase/integrase [Candidatus Neomarinimicrobiota bacterium]